MSYTAAMRLHTAVTTTRQEADTLAALDDCRVVEHEVATDSDGNLIALRWWELVPDSEKAPAV